MDGWHQRDQGVNKQQTNSEWMHVLQHPNYTAVFSIVVNLRYEKKSYLFAMACPSTWSSVAPCQKRNSIVHLQNMGHLAIWMIIPYPFLPWSSHHHLEDSSESGFCWVLWMGGWPSFFCRKMISFFFMAHVNSQIEALSDWSSESPSPLSPWYPHTGSKSQFSEAINHHVQKILAKKSPMEVSGNSSN